MVGHYITADRGVGGQEGCGDMTARTIVVVFPFVGDEVGGSHISAINLILGLDASRVRPVIVLHQTSGALAAYLGERGLAFVPCPAVHISSPAAPGALGARARVPLSMISTARTLSRFLQSLHADVVHTNDGRMHATWALPARLAGAKLLWHHRGDPGARGVNFLAPLLANHIVTVSRFAAPGHPLLPVGGRLTVLHSPFDHPTAIPDRETCRQALCAELAIRGDTRFVGYFGSLIERKRPVLFVDAVNAFLRRNPGVPIAGLLFGVPSAGGPRLDEAVRARAAELGISAHIHLMGFRSPVEPNMCAVDVLLVPAVGEPFGRTLIEAMLLGTPVIATNHGGNPEAIEHGRTGILVEPENPEAFVAPLERLLLDRNEWSRISEAAREDARRKYGMAQHVEGITDIYENILRRGKGPPQRPGTGAIKASIPT